MSRIKKDGGNCKFVSGFSTFNYLPIKLICCLEAFDIDVLSEREPLSNFTEVRGLKSLTNEQKNTCGL